MKYVYGPVTSRRLGVSLGVSLTPHKICSFDCVYCQLGRTTKKTAQRAAYAAPGDIIRELREWFQTHAAQAKGLDYVSIAGSGEPTLHQNIGLIIAAIRQVTAAPVALLTNSSLFRDSVVRNAVKDVDVIIPSLDAAVQDIFERIDRPAKGIQVEDVIEGLAALRREFAHAIWLEVMLVAGVNDGIEHILKLKEAIARIRPDKVQLNSPVRAPAEVGVKPVPRYKLERIKSMIGEHCEII